MPGLGRVCPGSAGFCKVDGGSPTLFLLEAVDFLEDAEAGFGKVGRALLIELGFCAEAAGGSVPALAEASFSSFILASFASNSVIKTGEADGPVGPVLLEVGFLVDLECGGGGGGGGGRFGELPITEGTLPLRPDVVDVFEAEGSTGVVEAVLILLVSG